MTRIKSSSSSSNTKTIDAFLRFMGLHSDGSHQKGNNGHGAARRRLKFLGILFFILVCILGLIHLCFPSHSAVVSDGVARHAKKFRRNLLKKQQQQPQRQRDTFPKRRGRERRGNRRDAGSKFSEEEQIDLILQGKLNLVDLDIDRQELQQSDEDTYEGVYGVFCKLNFDAHKEDPSGVPMFRDMVGRSPMCEGEYDETDQADNREDVPRGRVTFDLKDIADRVRQADQDGLYPSAKNLDLKGVVFHESRCGSTLVSNALIAMNPTKHRVYSESAPPIAALNVCARAVESEGGSQGEDDYEREGDGPCSVDQGAQILRDVMFLMGRSQDPNEERYFFKIQSAGTKSLSVFRRAFPKTPWIFVYRQPVEVLMSHFAEGKRSANCLRYKRNPPRLLRRLARKRGYSAVGGGGGRNDDGADDENDAEETQLQQMGPYEFCAAHLATLTETAADHISRSRGVGRAVNYASLPDILYEKIFPAWGVRVSDKEIENIKKISSVYSKGRDDRKGEWHEDSQKKEAMANPDVKQASKTFLQESFDRLEKMAKKNK